MKSSLHDGEEIHERHDVTSLEISQIFATQATFIFGTISIGLSSRYQVDCEWLLGCI